jgi:hypothetical protein
MLCAASRSILSSNRRTVSCKSSACYFSAATVSTNQDAEVAVTVPNSAIPPIISPKATTRPVAVDKIAIAPHLHKIDRTADATTSSGPSHTKIPARGYTAQGGAPGSGQDRPQGLSGNPARTRNGAPPRLGIVGALDGRGDQRLAVGGERTSQRTASASGWAESWDEPGRH